MTIRNWSLLAATWALAAALGSSAPHEHLIGARAPQVATRTSSYHLKKGSKRENPLFCTGDPDFPPWC